jgi:2-iminobutanoate/2-iminopropanoate deaminase
MPKREISSHVIRKPVGVFSQATAVEAKGRLVFVSGMTARRSDGSIAGIGDITEQTRQVCENIKAAVEAAGGTPMVEVTKMVSPDYLIEINAIAVVAD